ncbi:MAG: hypothetical protein AB7F78_07860 [Hyphomicrobiaceae bacterium]
MTELAAKHQSRREFGRQVVAAGMVTALGSSAGSAGPAAGGPVSPETRSPLIGVNVGYGMRAADAAADIHAFEKLLGRPVDFIADYGAQATWAEALPSATHAMRTWREVVVGSRRKLLWHQPLTMEATPLADVAAGRYDDAFLALATIVRNQGFYEAVIDLGWDMNADWVRWSATPATKDAYIAAFRRVAAIFRKVSSSFKICWSPARHEQALPPPEAWPGDEHVDIIGMALRITPPPPGIDMADFFDNDIIGQGSTQIAGRASYALAWLAEHGASHGKPLIVPELAFGSEIDTTSLAPANADDDVLVTRLAEWFTANDVLLHCWRDLPHTEGSPYHSRISRTSTVAGVLPADPADERPRLSTAFRKAWGKG